MKKPTLICALLFSISLHAGEYKNFAGMTFVDIPAGDFLMGSCEASREEAFLGTSKCKHPVVNAEKDEQPQHNVSIKRFQFGKYEVTLGEFKKWIIDNPSFFSDGHFKLSFMEQNRLGDQAPVVFVSWRHTQDFINWLNQIKPGSDKGKYRLASESEWEYAARARTLTAYSFGDKITTEKANFDQPWNAGQLNLAPVGKYKPNSFGLHDMHGNVFEWVQDCWNDSYSGAPTDGSAWESGDCSRRVMRGGSWSTPMSRVNELRSAVRLSDEVKYKDRNVGFRVVRELP